MRNLRDMRARSIMIMRNPRGMLRRRSQTGATSQASADQLRAKIDGYRQDFFSIGAINFEVDLSDPTRLSTTDRLMALKHWDHVDVYLDRISEIQCDRMLEFGIHQGGSTLMYHQLFEPAKIAAIDYLDPVDPVVELIEREEMTNSISLHFNQDQADAAGVERIISSEFDGPLDVVIDDGSHLYAETKSAFTTAFPHVRPGGLYMIEDWGWAHWKVEPFQDPDGWWRRPDEPAMSNLIFQTLMMAASHPELIESVEVFFSLVVIKRGKAEVPRPFAIEDYYVTQGRPFTLL